MLKRIMLGSCVAVLTSCLAALTWSCTAPAPSGAPEQSLKPAAARADRGFRSAGQLNAHYQKHGSEFGNITKDEYLGQARRLRDAPIGGNVLEIVRKDGVITRFDRETGAFIAFERGGTIRTFFRPNLGESYFRRQAQRPDVR